MQFAPSIKDKLHFTQYEINLIGTLTNLGTYLGAGPALFQDYFGPRPTCLLASILMFTGCFLAYCGISRFFYCPYWLLGLFFCIMGNGSSGSYTTSLSSNIKNFTAEHRGKVVGILAAVFGISSAFYSSIYRYIFKGDLEHFMLFTAISTGGVPLIGFIFMNVVKKKPEELTEVKEDTKFIEVMEAPVGSYTNEEINIALNSAEAKMEAIMGQQKDYTPFQMVLTIDFWLFAMSLFAGIGSGLVVINSKFLSNEECN